MTKPARIMLVVAMILTLTTWAMGDQCTESPQIMQGPSPSGDPQTCAAHWSQFVLGPCLNCCNDACLTTCIGNFDHCEHDDPNDCEAIFNNCLDGCTFPTESNCSRSCFTHYFNLVGAMCDGPYESMPSGDDCIDGPQIIEGPAPEGECHEHYEQTILGPCMECCGTPCIELCQGATQFCAEGECDAVGDLCHVTCDSFMQTNDCGRACQQHHQSVVQEWCE